MLQASFITVKWPSIWKLPLQNKLAHEDGQNCLLWGMEETKRMWFWIWMWANNLDIKRGPRKGDRPGQVLPTGVRRHKCHN